MAVARRLLLAAGLLLFSSGLHCSSPPPGCSESCTCQGAPLLNCSSSGLSSAPQHIQDSVTALDLSHNLLSSVTLLRAHRSLRNVWLGNNSITRLSLCVERNVGSRDVTNRRGRRLGPWRRRGCVSWAPSLQLLSVEKNQLEQLPEGLEGSKSLQVLQLSFNRISTLRPGDVRKLPQLKELHLRHNLITSVDPLMFQDLAQLRVLDLSFNMLTSLHPLTYPSLRSIGADVRLDGNRWHCDCSLRGLRRRMVYDDSRGLQTWRVLCDSPAVLSGRDLLQLEEDDLNCLGTENMSGLHRDVSVYSGSEVLLTCSTQDPVWWTPSVQSSRGQPQVISDITDRDAGLYVCVSEDHRVVSVFNLQISKVQGSRRHTRSLHTRNQQVTPRTSHSQSEFNLAVCLSVFITFFVAFILGVFLRPYIDVLWKRVTTKKRSTPADSEAPVEQGQYDNEAFSSGEEPGQVPAHRERRVTFNTEHVDIRDENNVHYYDTVVGGEQEVSNKAAVVEREARQTGSKVVTSGGRAHVELEPIPDPDELEERSLSSCSDSSHSDKVLREKPRLQRDTTLTKGPQLEKESVQQRPEVAVSTESTGGIPEFASEPFSDWSPHTRNHKSKDFDLWQEKEEQFEFSDSVRSASERSSIDEAPASHKHKRHDASSSSSYFSDDGPTQYTVNSDHEEDGNKETTRKKRDIQRPAARPERSSSSESSDGDLEPVKSTSVTKRQEERKDTSTSGGSRTDRAQRRTRAPSLSSSSSSSSDSEDETHRITPGTMNPTGLPLQSPTLPARFPTVDLEHIPRVKRRLDIKAPSLGSEASHSSDSENETHRPRKVETAKPSQTKEPASSSSSDSEDEALGHTGKLRPAKVDVTYKESETQSDPVEVWPVIDLQRIPHIKRRLDIRAPSPDSSDSEEEISGHTGRRSATELEPPAHARWPVLDFDRLPRINRRLDIKAPSPASESSSSSLNKSPLNNKAPSTDSDSSSSSDSEDEITNRTVKQETAELPLNDPDAKWPVLDFEHPPHIRRRLDIKAPPPASDSSSSSDSEDEATKYIKKEERDQILVTRPAPHVRHKSDSDSSSSSDSEDELTTQTKKLEQGEIHLTTLPGEISQTAKPEPETRWPIIDLELTTHIKRRLDIKAPSPDSDPSSSSDSEKEISSHTGRRTPTQLEPPAHARWPVLDFDRLPRIKRRLDIKAPSPASGSSLPSDTEDKAIKYIKKEERDQILVTRPAPPVRHESDSDSSSSSDSEDEITNRTVKQETAELPLNDPDAKWPVLDFEHPPHIRRRLDIKAPPPASDSSSSSDSEDEAKKYIKKEERDQIHVARPAPNRRHESDSSSSSSESEEEPADQNLMQRPLDAKWPTLDLERVPHLKRRLDIKTPPPPPHSPSKSEVDKYKKKEVHVSKLPVTNSETAKWPVLDLENMSLKRRLDIKAPSQDSESSSSSNSEDEAAHGHMERSEALIDLKTQWPTVDLGTMTGIKRRLDIKSLTPPHELLLGGESKSHAEADEFRPFFTSSSSDEAETLRNPPMKGMSDAKWPELDLSRATHVKRRLDIKARTPSHGSCSSSDSEDEDAKKDEVVRRPKSPLTNVFQHPKEKPSITLEKYTVITDSSSTATQDKSSTAAEINPELQSRWATMNLGISRFKKRLDITSRSPPSSPSARNDGKSPKARNEETRDQLVESDSVRPKRSPSKASDVSAPSQTESSSSSTSEDERTRHSAGVPRIKRYLNVKAPSPDQSECSSSCSEGEGQLKRLPPGESRHEWTDSESVITYKRSIMKAPSLPSESHAATHQHDMGFPSFNFDDVVRKRINHHRSVSDLDLPPQIRWTGHLSDLSVHSAGRNLDMSPQTPEPDKSTGRTNEILKTLSEEKREKRGLNALKVMSSERRTWETEEPLDLGPRHDTSFNHRWSEDVKQPLKQFHVSSTSTDERRAADLLYGVRSYRSRDRGHIEPPQEAPPPVPETPPPDEAAEPTPRSPWGSGAAGRKEEGSSALTPQSLVRYLDSSMNASDV
ncbi:protein clarinet [Betta splendens]|uniref:Protein clarinet n=1 Tax=Betta splendens TaxID=158456 RepID=A0A6P7M826_BETSP|nr:protein clarinet [Betta splendens]